MVNPTSLANYAQTVAPSQLAPVSAPNPDIVVIGGGPIGLWTAIQTKLLTKKEVLIVEKYSEYKRADIRLSIDNSSLSGIPHYEPLKKLVKEWGNHTVPIKVMEDELTKCAHDLGIRIIKGEAADPIRIQERYLTARVFIGADGARSTVRKELFGDQYKFNTPLQYIAQVQYLIKTPKTETENGDSSYEIVKNVADTYIKQKFAGHLITQNIRPLENGRSQVTLRIFIDEKTYKEMADATFSNPYYFEKDLDKVPDLLRDTLIKWWGTQYNQDIITDSEKANKVTVIPLASYAAKEVFKVTEKKNDSKDRIVTALVGDASQAYPFFRAVNNGLLLGTRLAKCIAKAFEALDKAEEKNASPNAAEKGRRAKIFASYFNSYSRYSTRRAYIERIKAFVKNLFIVFSNNWIKISSRVPWQSVRMDLEEQIKCYQRGADLWEKLSGTKPPPLASGRSLKSMMKKILSTPTTTGTTSDKHESKYLYLGQLRT